MFGICEKCVASRVRLVRLSLNVDLAAERARAVGALLVVGDRVHDGQLLLPVVARQASEVVAAGVEPGAVALALQVDRRDRLLEVERLDALALDAVVGQEPLVREHRDVPAPAPFLVDVETPGGLDRAAEIAVLGAERRRQERRVVALEDAGEADVVGAGEQAMAPFGLAENALAREEGRLKRQIHVRRDVPVERDGDAGAERARGDVMRREEAGLALHRRIGRPEIRHVGDRDSRRARASRSRSRSSALRCCG